MKSHGTGSSFAQFNTHKMHSLLKMRMCIPGQAQYESLSQHLYLSSPLSNSSPVHLWFLYGLAHTPVSENDCKGLNNVLSSIKIITLRQLKLLLSVLTCLAWKEQQLKTMKLDVAT